MRLPETGVRAANVLRMAAIGKYLDTLSSLHGTHMHVQVLRMSLSDLRVAVSRSPEDFQAAKLWLPGSLPSQHTCGVSD
jgi:hypothetical protein